MNKKVKSVKKHQQERQDQLTKVESILDSSTLAFLGSKGLVIPLALA